ncbi:hypothetical protein ID858_06550, partial [Xenorhabdus sp. DI]|uniref:hypothetical protein n=1 Tax=Xenorhabdus doucetiae TaxID=351671 RepID=UPI0019AEAD24
EAVLVLTTNQTNKPNKIDFLISAHDKRGNPVTDFPDKTVTYNVINNTPEDLIILKTENEFIAPPTIANPINDKQSKFNLYTGAVHDGNNNPIGNIQIIIAAQQYHKLSSSGLVEITQDPVTGTNTPIDIMTLPNGQDFFVLTTDPQGQVRFRAYPIQGQTGRVDFVAKIQNLTRDEYTAAICIYPAYSKNHPLANPFINEMEEGGILKKLPGRTDFTVSINSYAGYMQPNPTDVLAFFTEYDGTDKKTLLSPTYRTGDINKIENIPFPFTYDQLEANKQGGLYYMVIPQEGAPLYSESLNMKYVLDEDERDIYDKVKVYTSHATPPIDVYSEENETFEWHGIILSMINQQRKAGQSAKGTTGLYVVITGTSEQSNENLPQLGSKGYLNVYVKTPNSRNTHNSYPFQLPPAADPGKQTGHCTVNIPYCDINRAGPSFSQGLGTLSFDYYIENSDGSKTYSKEWSTKINTVLPNQSHDDNDGCDPLSNN